MLCTIKLETAARYTDGIIPVQGEREQLPKILMHNLRSSGAHKHMAGTKLEAGDNVTEQTLPQNPCSQGLLPDQLPRVVTWLHPIPWVFPPSISPPQGKRVTDYFSFYLIFFLLPEVSCPPP